MESVGRSVSQSVSQSSRSVGIAKVLRKDDMRSIRMATFVA
jgi:hypothetical protein